METTFEYHFDIATLSLSHWGLHRFGMVWSGLEIVMASQQFPLVWEEDKMQLVEGLGMVKA